jgi:hypothetical protein
MEKSRDENHNPPGRAAARPERVPVQIQLLMCAPKNNETMGVAPETKQNAPGLYIKDRGRVMSKALFLKKIRPIS